MATLRVRIFPVAELRRLATSTNHFSIARGNTGTLQNDSVTPACTPVGHMLVEPDLSTLRPAHSKNPLKAATVLASFRDEQGNIPSFCPRSSLQRLVNRLETEHSLTLLLGFEIEFILLKLADDPSQSYEPGPSNHAWSTLTPTQHATTVPILAEIVTSLGTMGITVQQFHSESGSGQYEIVLPPLPPLAAIDTLVQARQAVSQLAHAHGYRATLHPCPSPAVGSGQHVHISLASSSLSDEQDVATSTSSFLLFEQDIASSTSSFFASVLQHLPAICAFTLPNASSYERVVDDHWTGGTWCAWGTQNRETPLRKISDTHWEVRCLDGLANPYFALAAILAAGLEGVSEGMEMEVGDCRVNPSQLSEEERRELGIVRQLPRGIEEALEELEEDEVVVEGVGVEMVGDYVVMKRAEGEMLGEMSEEERRLWLMERY